MKVQTTIQKWGNSLAIRITGSLKTIPRFTENMPVEVNVDKKGLTIHPILEKKKLFLFSEAQLLKNLTRKNIHADEIADVRPWEFKHDE
ncbi:MAG: growth regulator [Gammaproteobacteria bacterium]|jgi:antitoxin MazE|nr:growth regulator [Gammaproteobacteria bacterium]